MPSYLSVLASILISSFLACWAPALSAAPERGLSAAFNHPGLILGPEDRAEAELVIRNLGTQDETFLVTVLVRPEGWQADLKSFSTSVTGLFLAGEDKGALTFKAWSGDEIGLLPPGEYLFQVQVASRDGVLVQRTELTLTVLERQAASEALVLTTSYPEVKGSSDGRFSFTFDLKNQGADDALVTLLAEVPQDWEAIFKPSYEDKQISSIQIPKGQSRTLNLDLNPAFGAAVGSYPVTIKAESSSGKAETGLLVHLTGTYKIRAVPTNELLSTSTEVGRPVTLSLFIINEGSAPQREINFVAVKPDNWKVDFKPEKLAGLEGRKTPLPVEMTITPGENALVGDYGVGFSAQGEKAQSALDFRVTVKASAAWAWVGSAVIILVILGLALTFRRLGRR